MPLIQRLSTDHTIHEFRTAARLRFREASRLAVAGDRLAAIYLGGYAAEILLKAAYFRLTGWGIDATITVDDIRDAKTYAKTLGLVWTGNLHQLTGWSDLLVEERKKRKKAFAPAFARSLQARARHIYRNWREHLRYKPNRPFQGEVTVVLQGAQWFLDQYPIL